MQTRRGVATTVPATPKTAPATAWKKSRSARLDVDGSLHHQRVDDVSLDHVHDEIDEQGEEEVMWRLRERREQSRNRADDCSEIGHECSEEGEDRKQEPSLHAGKRQPQPRQVP